MPDDEQILSEADTVAVMRRYQARIAALGVTFESMASGNLEKQRIRHAVHASALRGTAPSVLDVGCGIGQFYEFLRAQGFVGSYTGYDIVPEYIALAQATYPQATFRERNIFAAGIDGVYDTITMSQVLNNRYAASDNLAVMEAALRLSFAHTRVSVSIDMMSTHVDYQDEALYYYDPGQIFAIARRIARRVVLRHDYRPHEFCIQLFHDDVEGYVP